MTIFAVIYFEYYQINIMKILTNIIEHFLHQCNGFGPNVKDHRAGEAGSGASPCWARVISFPRIFTTSKSESNFPSLE